MNQMAASATTLPADAPLPGQGDAEMRPKPDPRTSSSTVAAVAATAPAMIAGQETADLDDSGAPAGPERSTTKASMTAPSNASVLTHGEQQNDGNRYPQHPQQNSTTHSNLPSAHMAGLSSNIHRGCLRRLNARSGQK